VYCVPNVGSFSGLSILDYSFNFKQHSAGRHVSLMLRA
jgi:hypothetical protein